MNPRLTPSSTLARAIAATAAMLLTTAVVASHHGLAERYAVRAGLAHATSVQVAANP